MKMHIRRMSAMFIACIGLVSGRAWATDWYVDGLKGKDDASGASPYAAFKNPWKGLAVAKPGDTVHIMPTIIYSALLGFDNTPVNLNHGGAPGQILTIMGGDGTKAQRPIIRGTDNFAVQLDNGANYVLVTNLDVEADNVQGNRSWYGIYTNAVNHVTIRGNSVHDSGGGGIGTNGADYVNIDSNTVYNNAFNINSYCGSGISLYHSTDSDNAVGLKNQVKNNIVYMNATVVLGSASCNHSDGNGIIIDDSRHTQSDNIKYKSATSVYNNVIVGNGGRGVEIFNSDNVMIYHNSTFHNILDPLNSCYSCGEINVDTASNIKISNNIVYSNGLFRGENFGTNAGISIQRSSGVNASNNIMWNDTHNQNSILFNRSNTGGISVAAFGSGNIWVDPLFTLPVLSAASGNFHVLGGSKAYGAGNPATSVPIDLRNTARSTKAPTLGAYE